MPKDPLPKAAADKSSRRPRRTLVAAIAAFAVLGLASGGLLPSADAAGESSHHSAVVSVNASGEAIDAAGASVTITGDAASIQAAGAKVEIDANASGSVSAAGAEVVIDGQIGGDLRAGGAAVDVSGTVGGDTYVAGASLTFGAAASGDVNIGGASVTIGENASIAGNLMAGGASVVVDGTVTGAVDIGGSAVLFNGSVDGPITLYGDLVTIGSSAEIKDDVTVVSKTAPVIETGASIGGQVLLEEPSRWWVLPNWLWLIVGAVAVAAGTIIAGLFLLLLGRGTFEDGLGKATFQPISSGLIGLAVLILLPIVTIILMTTVIGTSIGIALFLTIPFLLVAGHALVSACIGVWLFDRVGEPRSPGRIVLFLIIGAVIVAAISIIPFVGWIFAIVVGLVGIGAYTRSLVGRMSYSANSAHV